MNKDLISRQDAIDIVCRYDKSHMTLKGKPIVGAASIVIELEDLPSAQPDNRIAKIADLVEGTIDHFKLDDAMDLLYQIKDVLK